MNHVETVHAPSLLFLLHGQRKPHKADITQRKQSSFPAGNLSAFTREDEHQHQDVGGKENHQLFVHHWFEGQRRDDGTNP